jgi:hypothetical protein
MPKKNNPETLALAMDYAAAMEACAAYVQVSKPAIRTPEDAFRVVRPIIDAATGGDRQESFMVLLLLCRVRHKSSYAEFRIMPSCRLIFA